MPEWRTLPWAYKKIPTLAHLALFVMFQQISLNEILDDFGCDGRAGCLSNSG